MSLIATYKELAIFSSPISLSRFINVLGLFIGMLMIAEFGKEAVAAGALINLVFLISTMFVTGFFSASSIYVSKYLGMQDHEKVSSIIKHKVWISILGSIFVALFYHFIGPLLHLLKQPEKIIHDVSTFYHIMILSALPTVWFMALEFFYLGLSRPNLVFFWKLFDLGAMLIASYIFIFGKLGFPEYQLLGLAYGIVLSKWLSSLLFTLQFLLDKTIDRKKGVWIDGDLIKKIFMLGYPQSFQTGIETLSLSMITIMSGWLGTVALAAQQVATQLNILSLQFSGGLAQGATILISKSRGENDIEGARLYEKASMHLTFILCTFVFLLVYLFNRQIIGAYLDFDDPRNAKSIALAIPLLYTFVANYYTESVRFLLSSFFRAYENALYPMIVGIFFMVIFLIPLSYFLGFTLGFSVSGIRLGYALSGLLASLVLLKKFKSCYNR